MSQIKIFLVFFSLFFFRNSALAYKTDYYWLGLGYYSENVFNSTSQSADGSSKFLGEKSFPLLLKYDFSIGTDWFFAPQLSYTLLPRKTAGDSAKVTNTHLIFQFGQNFNTGSEHVFDWSIGPGYFSQSIKGNGGTVVLNNGGSFATFAKPGRTSHIQKITLNLGTSYSYQKLRFGLDLFFLDAFENKSRSQNLMFSFSYPLNGVF